MTFEKDFLIGAATAAHQVEEAISTATTGPRSIWYIRIFWSPAAMRWTIITDMARISV